MMNVILVIHLFLALGIIGLVLLQRSEGGGLGIGGGGGLGGVATPQGAASILTRATAICAAAFFCTSLILGVMAGQESKSRSGILDEISAAPAAAQEQVMDAVNAAEEALGDVADEVPAAPVAE